MSVFIGRMKKCKDCDYYRPLVERGTDRDYGACGKTMRAVVKNEICVIDALERIKNESNDLWHTARS